MSLPTQPMKCPDKEKNYVNSVWTVSEDGNLVIKTPDSKFVDLGYVTDIMWTKSTEHAGYVKWICLQVQSSHKWIAFKPTHFCASQKEWPDLNLKPTVQLFYQNNKKPKKLSKMMTFKCKDLCSMK